MGVLGNSPGKRERSRSDEENGWPIFRKFTDRLRGGSYRLGSGLDLSGPVTYSRGIS